MITATSNIPVFNSALARYMEMTSKLPNEVLANKGQDLGIRLYQGFRDRRYGGPQRNAGIARRDLASRTAAGRGTAVRDSLLRDYAEERIDLAKKRLPLLHSADAKDRRKLRGNLARRSNLWRIYVGKEIRARQRGIGVLAASFLWYKRLSRFSVSQGKVVKSAHVIINRTGRPLGQVEKGDGYLRIVSKADGITKVNDRYGIVDRALGDAAADMMTYVQRKERENFNAAFRQLGVSAA